MFRDKACLQVLAAYKSCAAGTCGYEKILVLDMKHFFCVALVGIVVFARACVAAPSEDYTPVTPVRDTIFTTTRQINDLQIAPDGTLWAATAGGILRRAYDGKWTKWTRQDGLPSHEARRITLDDSPPRAQFPVSDAVYENQQWRVIERQKGQNVPASTCSVSWRGAVWTADVNGLHKRVGENARVIALPPSKGTHISALLVRGDALWAALFGDDLWRFDGTHWSRIELGLPAEARDITALAGDARNLWVGTRRGGIWRYDFENKIWQMAQWSFEREPFDTNVQNIAAFDGALWFSTLEEGLVARTAEGWKHYEIGELSSNAPRQIVRFGNELYVRYGGGQVDKFDGKKWQKNVFPKLPRGKILALCADENHLFLGQWGGWSEWDGIRITHFLRFSALQGLPPLSLHATANTLWFGTQSRGLIEAKRTQGSYDLKFWDERHALPDDWITTIAGRNDDLALGTFVGGAAWRVDKKWQSAEALQGENVTAMARDGDGWWIATRHGLWLHDKAGRVMNCQSFLPQLDSELQALQLMPQGLWIGARTGIFFLSRATLDSLQKK